MRTAMPAVRIFLFLPRSSVFEKWFYQIFQKRRAKMYFDQAKFGCRLRTLRKRRRMTQETLAGALNISIDHLSKIEHGKRGVSIDLLLDISEAVDTSLDYLLKGTAHTPLQMKELIGRLQELHDQMAAIYENPF
ncbi:MAG: helix-turn-helix domain-containing protein [Oscillospiraceae bacterium]